MTDNIKKVSAKDFRTIYFLSLFTWGFLWLVPGIALGLYTSISIKTDSVVPFFSIMLLVPIVVVYLLTLRKVNKINSVYQISFSNANKSVNKADYYHTSDLGGTLVVDVAAKKIGIATVDPKSIKLKDSFGFSSDKLLGYKSVSPGVTTFETLGNVGSIDKLSVANRNLQAKAEAARQTGLYMDLDDVSRPQVFVPMNYSDAEKWHLIFKKLIDGTLESQVHSMQYPPLN